MFNGCITPPPPPTSWHSMLRRLAISVLVALTTISQPRLGATDYLASSSEGFFHFPFRLYQPAGASDPLPLIVFLPGSGETFPMYQSSPPLSLYNTSSILGGGPNGNNNGVTDIIDVALGASFPAIVVVPQFLGQYPATGGGYHQWGHEPTKLNELIDYLRTTLPIDSRRIYLTGISAGGTGIWYALQQRPELHAAAVPASARDASHLIWISPEPNLPAINPAVVSDIPAWLFHGNEDSTIDADETRLMRNALVAAGGAPRFTEIVGMGHYGWENIYQENPAYTGAFVAPTTVVPASAPNFQSPTPPAPIAMDGTGTGLFPWLFSQEKPASAALLPLPQPGRKVLIDFGPDDPSALASSPDSQGRFWNSGAYSRDLDYALSVYGLPTGLHGFGLVDTTGTKCRVALRILAPFEGVGVSGVSSSVSYPSAAQVDWWSNPPPDRAAIRLEGLVPGALHRVKVFASRADGSGADRLTRYSIGAVTSDLQVTNNTGSVALLDEVESSPAGFLDLGVAPSPLRTGVNPHHVSRRCRDRGARRPGGDLRPLGMGFRPRRHRRGSRGRWRRRWCAQPDRVCAGPQSPRVRFGRHFPSCPQPGGTTLECHLPPAARRRRLLRGDHDDAQ